jgi:hypothetical protein
VNGGFFMRYRWVAGLIGYQKSFVLLFPAGLPHHVHKIMAINAETQRNKIFNSLDENFG